MKNFKLLCHYQLVLFLLFLTFIKYFLSLLCIIPKIPKAAGTLTQGAWMGARGGVYSVRKAVFVLLEKSTLLQPEKAKNFKSYNSRSKEIRRFAGFLQWLWKNCQELGDHISGYDLDLRRSCTGNFDNSVFSLIGTATAANCPDQQWEQHEDEVIKCCQFNWTCRPFHI